MPVAKLAGFLDMTEQEFRIQLLVFKHKMKNLVWTSGVSALGGEFQSASEVDFYIDKVRSAACLTVRSVALDAHRSPPTGHDPHRGHQSGSSLRRLLHQTDPQV